MIRRIAGAIVAAMTTLAMAGCSSSSASERGDAGPAATLRLGYFANLTHATPNVAVAKGFFTSSLGSTTLETQVFNAGPAAVEALFAGSLDAAYLGPNPAINAFTKSEGEAIRIVAGATTGGAALVVRPGISSAEDLRGKRLASPQLGGTQDVALRAWLSDNGLETTPRGSGDVTVVPQENAQTLDLFQSGEVDGAWVPEPWASRLVLEGGGHVLVDERDLWPSGKFVSTQLVVRTSYLEEHPETVMALLQGAVKTNVWINAHRDEAKTVLNAELKRLTSKALTSEVIDRAFAGITVTDDPVAASLQQTARNAKKAGLLKNAEVDGIYDLRLLNAVLTANERPTVDTAGLGKG